MNADGVRRELVRAGETITLRRVTGTQLDGRYVEVLADLLSGEGLEYRHADTADFDTEVDMERRINEAGA